MKSQSTNNEPLAHSARKTVAAQSYKAHVERVTAIATENAEHAVKYYRGDRDFFVEAVRAGAFFHDLGKLDEENQQVLMRSATEALPVKHWDASSAHLLALGRLESAVLAFAHHTGLPNYYEQFAYKELAFRIPNEFDRTNNCLADFIGQHAAITSISIVPVQAKRSNWTGLTRRIALSCLVDGDHTDTAEHYGNERPLMPMELRASDRLCALDDYVSCLSGDTSKMTERNRIRREIYLACRNAPTDARLWACDSPVGTGKTTAIMAHLLRAAADKKLRHIFVVLPYTNIIKQSVQVYQKALVLRGENPEAAVAAHHHQADFSTREFRHLAQLWNAPVTVTTAVQFFETLGSRQPSRLRKLHELPGSAILIDESHAAIPSWLWPQMWQWLNELAENWGCHIVFASGSLVRFWALEDFVKQKTQLPELVSQEVRDQALVFETNRVTYHTHETLLNLSGLINFVLDKPGPRLVILNTVQSAAIVADAIRKRCGGNATYHLSTSLCPIHREPIVDKISERLKQKGDNDWTLVATSCVEAGMDFSFHTAFREHCGLVNLIQIGGRANRLGEYEVAEVWDFYVVDPLLPPHPAFQASQEVLTDLFREDAVDAASSTEAIRREIQRETIKKRSDELKDRESKMDYPQVAQLCRVIDSDTRIVIVNPQLVERLEQRIPVSHRDIVGNSVQIWAKKIEKLKMVRPVRGSEELLAWIGKYDPDFLGYMAGVIPLLEAQDTGLLLI
jgi:CRISPR-associated endonuclease/helicase Cas3